MNICLGGILEDLSGAKSSIFGEDFIKSEEIKAEIQDDDFAAQDFIEVNYFGKKHICTF